MLACEPAAAESPADAQFVRAPGHVKRQNAVDASRRQRKTQQGERREDCHRKTRLDHFLFEHFGQREWTSKRLVGVDALDDRTNRIEQQVGIADGAYRERALDGCDNRVRHHDRRLWI